MLRVLVRALGPSLASAGVTTPLANPTLSLRDANGNVIASNDNWKDSQQAAIAATGKAPRTIMNRPSLGYSHRETTLPSLPGKTEPPVLPWSSFIVCLERPQAFCSPFSSEVLRTGNDFAAGEITAAKKRRPKFFLLLPHRHKCRRWAGWLLLSILDGAHPCCLRLALVSMP